MPGGISAPGRARKGMPGMRVEASTLKSCCAQAYASPWVTLVLGDYWHPGGRELTERLCEALGLTAADSVGDVACGTGAAARLLHRRFGCGVNGVDYGASQVEAARRKAKEEGIDAFVTFTRADAEELPWGDASLDVVICECALCTFPDPRQAAAEWTRVLRPGGRLGLTDVTRCGDLPPGLDDIAAWVSCLGGARTSQGYSDLLMDAGFQMERREDRSADLSSLVDRVGRAALAWLDFQGPQAGTRGFTSERVRHLLGDIQASIRAGHLGYVLLTARRP